MGKFAYKESLQVRGYPSSLKLVKHSKSRFYWVYFSTYIASKGTIKIRKSTKTENQSKAMRFAKDFYEDLIVKKKMGDFPIDKTFARYTTKLINLNEERVKNNSYSLSQFNNDKYRIENDLLPYFAQLNISEVSYLHISNFLNLLADKGYKVNSQKKYLTIIRKVLSLAIEDNEIIALPKFPDSKKLKTKTKKQFVPYPKGRPLDQKADDEVRSLINGTPIRRDLLIEYLHLIQDKYRCIKKRHLAALADIMKIPFAEAFEVASFYAHFDVINDDEVEPPEITIRVCDSLTCELKGSDKLIKSLKKNYNIQDVRVLRAPCMGLCDFAPAVEVGHNHIKDADLKKIDHAISNKITHSHIVEGISYDDYTKAGGYKMLKDCYAGKIDVDNIIATLQDSGLKGMGGAGFPAGQKWKFVRMEPGPRLMTINGDEGEPGTFKDKLYLEKDLHRFFEGMLIAAWVVEAKDIYIYLRDEYPGIRDKILRELKIINTEIVGNQTKIHLRRGAGAYICGEESAMIESIEGKRGLPRHKPPFVSKVGLFGKPTLNHNIETVFWVREILEKGSLWFSSQGKNGRKGPHSYSVSGRVKNPGVKLAPAGITMNELIKDYCGGMEDGHKFYGYLPGGASGGLLPSTMANIPLDFGTLEEHGCFIGSGAVVVFSDKDDVTKVVLNLLKFFEDESCGQCTPCRVGTEKAVKLLEKNNWNKTLLNELVDMMGDASICGLGQAAGNPIRCALKYFGKDIS